MTQEHKLKTRIAALLNHAKGTSNEAEAEAFLAKAMDLMEKHQIDVSDLADGSDPVIEREGYTGAASGHAWRWELQHCLAIHYGCKTILHRKYVLNKQGKPVEHVVLKITGRESALVTLEVMYPFICQQVNAAAKVYALQADMSVAGAAKRVALALQCRIHSLGENAPAKDPETPAGRNALTIMDQVTAAYEAAHPSRKENKARNVRLHRDAKTLADGISLHRQTSGAGQKQIG